jgi:hypothetical protein
MNSKICVISCLVFSGIVQFIHADNTPVSTINYRKEVSDSLQELQSYLDNMFQYQELTPEQYKTECQRVRQLGHQLGVEFHKKSPMTEHERNTDITMLDQIQKEATQWSASNRAIVPYAESITSMKTIAR